jgi:CheY-like chemotaxis protein
MPCVLIVEDDPESRAMLEALVATQGYDVMSAANGLEALDRMAERIPCVVLLDVDMPVMDGYQFRAMQLRDPHLASVPVICVSGFFQPDEVIPKTGVPCFQKPIDFERLLSDIRDACGQFGSSSQNV